MSGNLGSRISIARTRTEIFTRANVIKKIQLTWLRCIDNLSIVLPAMVFIHVLVLLTACGSTADIHYNREKNDDGKPNWVADGTMTLTTPTAKAFIAVGSASILGSEFAMQATKANMYCKADMKKMVSRFVAVTARDYLATGGAELSGFTTQDIDKNIELITEAVMEEVHVIEHWVDNREKNVYAVSEISFTRLEEIISRNPGINDGFKVFLKKAGESIFDRIATDHGPENQLLN